MSLRTTPASNDRPLLSPDSCLLDALVYRSCSVYTLLYMDTNRSRQSRACPHRSCRPGGTTTDIIAVIILLGLVGLGVWWVIKTMGQTGEQYTQALIKAKKDATGIECQMNLRAIWQVLQANVAAEGAYPETRQEFEHLCGSSRLLRCPDPNGSEYVYLPPKRIDAEIPQIVVYESKAVHDGRCSVLLSDGRLGFVHPEELKATLEPLRQQRR